jgi:streptomycin 6-kinase
MGTTDDTLRALNRLAKTIEAQRQLQLQAHGVLTCLYEVLLHAECEEAVSYAQATYVARSLIDKSAEELDSVRISQLLDALAPPDNVDESRVLYVT